MYKHICGVAIKTRKFRLVDRFKKSFLKRHNKGGGSRSGVKSRLRGKAKPPHPKQITWQAFAFTFLPAKNDVAKCGFSVTCPLSATLHRSTVKRSTGCKRRKSFLEGDDVQEANAILHLKTLLLAAHTENFNPPGRLGHLQWKPTRSHLNKTKTKEEQDSQAEHVCKLEPESPSGAVPKKKPRISMKAAGVAVKRKSKAKRITAEDSMD